MSPDDLVSTGAETVPPGLVPTLVVPGLAEAAADARDPLARGATVGRYVVVARVGAGGMGVVYAAYDPELDRKVALKLLAPALWRRAGVRARIQREAQAMARLQHPNVVAVHDVGTHDGQVWLAMEFVEGETLGTWLKSQERTWREVLGVMRAVARGLAAAHAAGLVHRDIKPDNVMIGADGRARVMDFGLVRAQGDGKAREVEGEESIEESVRAPAGRLTEVGSRMGTPMYMAPEQHLGLEVDARADQFSWCVTCWEALYDQRPFTDHDLRTLSLAVVSGQLRAPPPGRRVPAWLRRTLERGLQSKPDRRFADMPALLAALRQGRARSRTRVLLIVVGLVLLVVAAGLVGVRVRRARAVRACEASAAGIREVWNDERRAAIAGAFAASGQPNAAASLERVAGRFDVYADAWQRRRAKQCVRAEVDGSLDAASAQAIAACLGDRQAALQGLVEQFSQGDAGVVISSALAAWNLPTVDSCADAARLPRADLRDEFAVQARLAKLRRELVGIATLAAIGKFAAAAERAEGARAEAIALGRPGPIVELTLAESAARDRLGEFHVAEQTARRALLMAYETGLDHLVVQAAARLVFVVGYRLSRTDEALRWGELGLAAVRRIGGGNPSDHATLLAGLAAAHGAALHAREELELSERSLALETLAEGPEHPNVAIYASNLGRAYLEAGEFVKAEEALDRALSLLEGSLGASHLATGVARLNRGLVELRRGAYDEAAEHLARAHGDLAEAFGADRLEAAYAGMLAARAHVRAGRFAAAEAQIGAIPPLEAAMIEAMRIQLQARLAAADGDVARALQLAASACVMVEEDPEDASSCRALLGELHLRRGDVVRAREEYAAAVAIAEPGLGPTGPVLQDSLTGLGEALLAAGDVAGAEAALERARALRAARPGEPAGEVRGVFALARLAWAQGREDEAVDLARRARGLLREVEGGDSARAELDVWLATRGG